MNEGETRAEHIDPALKAAGWGAIEGLRIRCENASIRKKSGAEIPLGFFMNGQMSEISAVVTLRTKEL